MSIDIVERMKLFLEERKKLSLFRKLSSSNPSIDFSSNDYLGLSKSADLFSLTEKLQKKHFGKKVGSTGSRLLNGHHPFIDVLELKIAAFHNAEAALVFNSGYMANSGLISTVARNNDLILYDESIHASLHAGILLSKAERLSFKHNNVNHLNSISTEAYDCVFVVTESLFSMDGSESPLQEIAELCQNRKYNLIVDEAHGFGIRGAMGKGRCTELNIENLCFARIYTYGKGGGFQGAAIVGSSLLREYLINYCKTFIYTTSMSSYDYCRLMALYEYLPTIEPMLQDHQDKIGYFNQKIKVGNLNLLGTGPIYFILIGDSFQARKVCAEMNEMDLDVRPIVSPTVPKGHEGIRIIIHSYNTLAEIDLLFEQLNKNRI